MAGDGQASSGTEQADHGQRRLDPDLDRVEPVHDDVAGPNSLRVPGIQLYLDQLPGSGGARLGVLVGQSSEPGTLDSAVNQHVMDMQNGDQLQQGGEKQRQQAADQREIDDRGAPFAARTPFALRTAAFRDR